MVGMSLTELMVALLLTGLLMSGITRVYFSMKSQFTSSFATLKDYQEWLWLSRQIRVLTKRAGHCGLYRWSHLAMSSKTRQALIPAVEIFSSSSTHLPATVSRQVLPGTDVLKFVTTSQDFVFSKGDSGIYSVELLQSMPVSVKKSYVICDRRHLELVGSVETKKTRTLYLDSPLAFQFREGAVVAVLQVVYVYVRQLDKVTALYLYVEQGHRGELSRRVNRMTGVLHQFSEHALLELTLNWGEQPLTLSSEI